MLELVLPIGTSGSGKTTWVNSINSDGKYKVVSADELRIELTGCINDKTKDDEVYRKAINKTVQYFDEGFDVIFDATNLTLGRRRAYISLTRSVFPNIKVKYHILPLNPELAKQRIKNDIELGVNRANVSNDTIDRHVKSYIQMLEDIKSETFELF